MFGYLPGPTQDQLNIRLGPPLPQVVLKSTLCAKLLTPPTGPTCLPTCCSCSHSTAKMFTAMSLHTTCPALPPTPQFPAAGRIEKYIVCKAFDTPDRPYLPAHVL